LISLNSVGAPTAAFPLTLKPDAGPLNTAPRGELTLKKFAGMLLGADKASGTPSQLISRRPLANEPATFAFSVPRLVRNASTWPCIAAALAPAALKTSSAAIAWAELKLTAAPKSIPTRFLHIVVSGVMDEICVVGAR